MAHTDTSITPRGTTVGADGTLVSGPPGGTTDPFIEELQGQLLQLSDLTSSGQTEIDEKVADIAQGVQTSQEASAARIESQFGRERTFLAEQGRRRITSAREAQRGFATNTALLRQINEETEKSLRDLDQRKEELILAGEAEAAGQIANLQLQALQFKQQALQNTFSNLLGLANFSISVKKERRLQRAQNFQEQSRIADIALEFGLEVTDEDTLDSIISKAIPLATEARQLELARMRADVRRANAEAAKAEQGQQFTLDNVTAEGLAATLNNLATSTDPFASQSIQAILGSIVDQHGAEGLGTVKRFQLREAEERFSEENLRKDIQEDINANQSRGAILASIEDSIIMTEEQKERARSILDELKPKAPSKTGVPAADIGLAIFETGENIGASIAEFFTGARPSGLTN